jgi:hypothetical protein
MGINTVVVMLNDFAHEWPEDMRRAMTQHGANLAQGGRFNHGKILSVAHADSTQIVAVRGNTGEKLSPEHPIDPKTLRAMSDILRGHGYTIRAPGRTRGEGPFVWGFAAKQEEAAKAAAAKEAQDKA